MFKIKHLPLISIILTIIIVTVVSSNLHFGKNHWSGILQADAKGYYAYLPAVFIYNDLNFNFFDKIEKDKYYNKNLFYDYRIGARNQVINKYYCGTAIAELPFFLTAHLLSYQFGFSTDGYSKLYLIFINIAAIFYLAIALIFLNKILKKYNTNEWARGIILFAIVFGTNVFNYTINESGMSHVFSLAFISMFIYYGLLYFRTYSLKYVIVLSVLLGLIILIRPVNGLILLIIPFISESFSNLKKGIKTLSSNFLLLIGSILLFLGIVSIQLIIYKIQTGYFFIYSYGKEGFNFANPHMLDILFSYKKGLFLYTPLLFISFLGGYYLYKLSKYQFFMLFGFLLLITYFLSSWWNWWYGGSFSSRVFIEYIPIFTILLGMALMQLKNKILQKGYIVLIFLFVIVCQIQTYQYRYYQIHWENMNKEKYWNVFLRIDKL